MFDRKIVDLDAEWSFQDEEIMHQNFVNEEEMNDFVNEDVMNDEDINDDNEQQAEEQCENEELEQTQDEHSFSESDHEGSLDDTTSSYNSVVMEAGEGYSSSEEEYCPCCDYQQYSEDDDSSREQHSQYIEEQLSDGEQQPIDYGDGVVIRPFSVEPILPCRHKQELSDEVFDTCDADEQEHCEECGNHIISHPYKGKNGTLYYRCLCGCSLVFDNNANLFFDISNKGATDVPDCKFHCPCGCDLKYAASDILLNPKNYDLYQQMVRHKFLSECTCGDACSYKEQCLDMLNEQ